MVRIWAEQERPRVAGTAAEILPVIDVDGLQVGDGRVGEITGALRKAYDDL
jgi:branched-subunit amino acid aminotransferase/4-amino-4-deoxychorismate lyase